MKSNCYQQHAAKLSSVSDYINFSFDPFVSYSKILGANGIYCVLFVTYDDFRTPLASQLNFLLLSQPG